MITALLLIQDVQLLCFTVIFGFMTMQHWSDPTRRWLWYSFLANGVGAVLDFSAPYLPAWIGHGINLVMIPLSYTLVNVAYVYFLRRHRWSIWVSGAFIVAATPLFLLWSGNASQVENNALVDLVLGLQTLLLAYILPWSAESSTQPARVLMSVFFFGFGLIEVARGYVTFVLHQNPDIFPPKLVFLSAVAYTISVSVLPLAFIWMINSRVEADLIQQNMRDPLTQLLNRRGLRRAMDREVAAHRETDEVLTVAMVDLDHFKQLNDTYGHASGDAILIGLASLLQNFLRESDTVARIGGEEFVLLLPKTAEAEAVTLLERLRAEVAGYVETTERGAIHVTASFGGTSTYAGSTFAANDLLREADLALYRAKQEGRNRVCFFAPEEDGETRLNARQYLV